MADGQFAMERTGKNKIRHGKEKLENKDTSGLVS